PATDPATPGVSRGTAPARRAPFFLQPSVRARHHGDSVSHRHLAGFDDAHVDAAQVPAPQLRVRYEPEGIVAEARRELPTPVVRLGRHLEQRAPEAEAG